MLVKVYNNDVGGALRKLKKKMFNEGIIKEVMDRRAYEKPSVKKRRKLNDAKRRAKKEQNRRLIRYGLMEEPKRKTKLTKKQAREQLKKGQGRPSPRYTPVDFKAEAVETE
jgi:small subunit ribosomal protein S21